MTRHLRVLTNSEIACFRRCPREHHYSYRLLVRPIARAKPLRFGDMFHNGLEAWSPSRDLDAALAVIDAYKDCDPFEKADARALMTGYHVRWAGADVEFVALESEFRAPLVHPYTGDEHPVFIAGGKRDGIVRENGRLRLLERKTAGQDITPGSAYWRALDIDSQLSIYVDGSRAEGMEFESILYDVVKKVALEPKKATPVEKREYTKPTKAEPIPRLYKNQRENDETVEEYSARVCEEIAKEPDSWFRRATIVRNERELLDARADVWATAEMILDCEENERYPRSPGACFRFNRECDYFRLCNGTASIDDQTLFRRAARAHEELAADAARCGTERRPHLTPQIEGTTSTAGSSSAHAGARSKRSSATWARGLLARRSTGGTTMATTNHPTVGGQHRPSRRETVDRRCATVPRRRRPMPRDEKTVTIPEAHYRRLDEAWGALALILDGAGKLDALTKDARVLLNDLEMSRATFRLGDDGDPE